MKKRYIVIIIVIAVYFTVFFLLYGKDNLKQSKLKTTLIIENSSVWQLENNKWTNMNKNDDITDLNWEEFNIVIDNKNIGKYNVVYDNKWYIFDSKRKPYNYDGTFLAYRANYDMKVQDFTKEAITDFTYVNKVLKENNLSLNQELTVSNYIKIDIDNDNQEETLYFISNAFPMETAPNNIFSIVFMEKNDIIYPIYKSIEQNKGLNGCKPYISAIIDVDEDNKYEFVLSCSKYSVETPIDMLYKLKNKEFKIIVSNQ